MSDDNLTNSTCETPTLQLTVYLGETSVESITVAGKQAPHEAISLPIDDLARLKIEGPEDVPPISIEVCVEAVTDDEDENILDPHCCSLTLYGDRLPCNSSIHTLRADNVNLTADPQFFTLEINHPAAGFQMVQFLFEIWMNTPGASSAEIRFDTLLNDGPPPPCQGDAPPSDRGYANVV